MAYDASQITVYEGLEAVWRRPQMFFGKPLGDPELLGNAFSFTVQQALLEEAPEEPLRLKIVVAGDRAFSIEDNGPGALDPAEATTTLMYSPKGPISLAAGLCSEVVVDVWRDGEQRRLLADRHGIRRPFEVVGDAERHGTRVAYDFDEDLLGTEAALPREMAAFLEGMFALPLHHEDVPRPKPGTTIEFFDHRDGTKGVLTAPAE